LNTYKNISNELRAFFSNHSFFKVLLPLDMILIIVCLGFMVLGRFVSLGIFGTFFYWGFILGLLLAYANFHELFLYMGLLGYGALNLILFIIMIFRAIFVKYATIYSLDYLVTAFIFGGLGYLVFKNTGKSSGESSGFGT
jgi:4-amino-4-deoxy-L-arabinose transferase-like glycosyltransferase